MKNLLLAGLLLSTVPALAQNAPGGGQETVTPFRKTNVVLVATSDSAKTALRKMAVIMQQKGFAVDRLDYDLQSISTKSHAYGGSVYSMTLLVIFEAGKLRLTGQWKGQAMGMTVEEAIAYTNAAARKAFAEMQALALAYPGGKVTYVMQP